MAPKTIYIKPAREGLIVRDPLTMKPLPEEGAHKPLTTAWRRYLKAGDVVITKAPKAPKE